MIHGRARSVATARLLGDGDASPFVAEGRAPCVVAFHGFTGTVSEIRPVVDAVAAAGYAVRAPLLPGHGTSALDLQGRSFDAWLDAGREVLDAAVKAHGRVVLLGFSLGSLVAMHLAAERGAREGSDGGVVGLAVLGNALALTVFSRLPLGVAARASRLGFVMPDWYLVKPWSASMTDRRAAARITTYDRHPLRAALEVYLAGKRARARAASITCPLLILHGARDVVCRPANAAWLAANAGTRDVRMRMLARSGHVIACDVEKDLVTREVLAFVRRFDAPPPAADVQTSS